MIATHSPWVTLAGAARSAAPACRLALIEGPAPGTVGVLGPDGSWSGRMPIPAGLAELGREALRAGRPLMRKVNGQLAFADPLLPLPRLLIIGGGHVGLALAPVALAAGFAVTVADDRPAYASGNRFPGTTVLCASPSDGLSAFRPGASDFVVIASRSHTMDYLALEAALQWPAAYVGLIGSRRKVQLMRQSLLEGGAVEPESLQQLRAPVGLAIGAETPAEIAVSIVAEMIAVRRGGPGVPLSVARTVTAESFVAAGDPETLQVWLDLAAALERKEACALATVVEVKGSTPRSAGARMLVFADGRYTGTIGGGSREAEICGRSQDCITTRQSLLYRAEYVEEQDALCGGAALILIELVA